MSRNSQSPSDQSAMYENLMDNTIGIKRDAPVLRGKKKLTTNQRKSGNPYCRFVRVGSELLITGLCIYLLYIITEQQIKQNYNDINGGNNTNIITRIREFASKFFTDNTNMSQYNEVKQQNTSVKNINEHDYIVKRDTPHFDTIVKDIAKGISHILKETKKLKKTMNL